MNEQKYIDLSVDGIYKYRKAEFEKMMKMSKEERKEYMRNKAREGQKFGDEIKRRAGKNTKV